ncbi:MAG: hypothetical protein Q4P66_10075 [Actinomycetaceae bacterium]|nr:hypothetical protein [Actinomycetaceae bacterium]
MDFIELAQDFLKHSGSRLYPAGFLTRMRYISDLYLDDSKRPQSVTSPMYLTDLGVRKFADPETIFVSVVGENLLETKEFAEPLYSISINELAKFLDGYILFTGDYSTAANVIHARKEDIVKKNDYRLYLYSAMILAAVEDVESLNYFDKAYDVAESIQDELSAKHRKSVACVKRFNLFDSALDILDEIRVLANKNVIVADTTNPISTKAFLALADNLQAFIHLKLNEHDSALKYILSASTQCRQVIKNENITPEFARYYVQVALNKAELFVKMKAFDDAYSEYKDNIDFCSIYCHEYLSEAYAIGSIGLFRMNKYMQALNWSTIAINLICREASPRRLKVARKIRVACLCKMNILDLANKDAELIDKDPLGYTLLES